MQNKLMLAEGIDKRAILQYYVPIETKQGTQLMREDVLDDLNEDDYEAYMDAIEYSSGFSMGGKRRQERKERREARRDLKAQGKADIASAKAEGIRAGTYTPGSQVSGVLGKITDAAGSFFNAKTGAGADAGSGEAPPAKSNTIYYIGGAVLLLGVIYLVAKPKKHA